MTQTPAFPDATVSGATDASAPDASADGGEQPDAEPSTDAEPSPDAEPAPDADPAPDAPGGPDAQPRDAEGGRDAQSAPDAGPVSTGCGTPQTSGTRTEMLTVAGTGRTYQLVVPNNYDPNRQYPLVFGFHGQGWQVNDFRMASLPMVNAAANSAIFVFPQGRVLSGRTGWDVYNANSADITLFDDLSRNIQSRFCVDSTRVFSFGRSFGGFMTNALNCARGGALRGTAVMMAGGPYFTCSRPSTSWWGTHNQDDGTVPFSWGVDARNAWISANGCSQQTMPVSPSPCVEYQGCAGGRRVVWCPNAGGNHSPAAYTNQAIWAFFESL